MNHNAAIACHAANVADSAMEAARAIAADPDRAAARAALAALLADVEAAADRLSPSDSPLVFGAHVYIMRAAEAIEQLIDAV